ncbi:hypothetical protein EWI07_09755 [Sporolactobacillus sp. THM7-4]|nr:hypothetical protein EWI07_09755 [Sporolactobacillus sp. THM7-4]
MDWSWLLFLACPLMMLPMMFMMMKGNHSDMDHAHHNVSNEINDLKKQNKILREELHQMKNKQ